MPRQVRIVFLIVPTTSGLNVTIFRSVKNTSRSCGHRWNYYPSRTVDFFYCLGRNPDAQRGNIISTVVCDGGEGRQGPGSPSNHKNFTVSAFATRLAEWPQIRNNSGIDLRRI